MLVFHQAIMVPNVNSNLLCPNQMRANNLRVQSIILTNQQKTTIVVPDVDSTGEGLRIPLSIYGVVSYFPSRKLMVEEYESTDLNYILDMTDSDTEWDPSSPKLAEQEEVMLDLRGPPVTNHQDHGWQSELWPCSIHILNLRLDWRHLVRHLAIVLLLVPSELGADIIPLVQRIWPPSGALELMLRNGLWR